MVHIATYRLFDLLPWSLTPLLIWRKFNKLIMVTRKFYKSLLINTIKTWGLLMGPNKMDLKTSKIPKHTQKAWAQATSLSTAPQRHRLGKNPKSYTHGSHALGVCPSPYTWHTSGWVRSISARLHFHFTRCVIMPIMGVMFG